MLVDTRASRRRQKRNTRDDSADVAAYLQSKGFSPEEIEEALALIGTATADGIADPDGDGSTGSGVTGGAADPNGGSTGPGFGAADPSDGSTGPGTRDRRTRDGVDDGKRNPGDTLIYQDGGKAADHYVADIGDNQVGFFRAFRPDADPGTAIGVTDAASGTLRRMNAASETLWKDRGGRASISATDTSTAGGMMAAAKKLWS